MTDSKALGDKLMESVDKAIALAKELQTKIMTDSKAPGPKFREFWIKDFINGRSIYDEAEYRDAWSRPFVGSIHVIEASAVTELEERLAVAVEAIENSLDCFKRADWGCARCGLDQEPLKTDVAYFLRETLVKIRNPKGGSGE